VDSRAAAINEHYSVGDLLQRFEKAFQAVGKDRAHLQVDDLAPADEYHVRGRQATVELAELAGIESHFKVLDIGCGLGGSARFLASQYGCHVTGLDVTAEYCAVAGELSQWVGLGERTSFRQGDAVDLPFADGEFDLVWSEHVQMNIPDKSGFVAEIKRVLKPRGRFVFHDIFSIDGQQPHFPVPWSEGPDLSFLTMADTTRAGLESAGFEATVWRDTSATTIAWFEAVSAKLAKSGPPTVGLHLLMGESTMPMLRNLGRSLVEKRIQAWQGVYDKS